MNWLVYTIYKQTEANLFCNDKKPEISGGSVLVRSDQLFLLIQEQPEVHGEQPYGSDQISCLY